MIDMTGLEKPEMLDATYDQVLSDLKGQYKEATGAYPLASWPETFLLETIAYQHILIQQLINQESLSNLLAFAKGARLDHLGALTGCARLEAQPAVTTLRFSFEDHSHAIALTKGIFVASKGGHVFQTTETRTLAPGENSADIRAECIEVGGYGNGYVAGEVSLVVEPMAYLMSASNLTVTSGGTSKETDERYRLRIQMSMEALSTAGPAGGYIYHAKTAHQSICDAKCWSPTPGEVRVCVLTDNEQGGYTTPAEIVDIVDAHLSADDVRPLTDTVEIIPPTPVTYTIDATIQVHRKQEPFLASSLATGKTKLETLSREWSKRLGRDIVPEAIIGELYKLPGVYRATTTIPAYTRCEDWEFPLCTGITLNAEVIDE
jgi:phage-related baseplate assembly protein